MMFLIAIMIGAAIGSLLLRRKRSVIKKCQEYTYGKQCCY